jgi:hypothetical protein
LAHLSGFVSGGGRDAGMAVNQVARAYAHRYLMRNCASEICFKKVQFYQGHEDDTEEHLPRLFFTETGLAVLRAIDLLINVSV